MMEESPSCPICFRFVETTQLICTHSFCPICLELWQRQSLKCPLCRGYVCPLDAPVNARTCKNFVLDSDRGVYAGIVVFKRDANVRIKSINPSDEFYRKGIRKGDLIVSINGYPITEHRQCVEIIEECGRRKIEFHVEVRWKRRVRFLVG